MDWLPGAARDPRGGFPWQVDCPTKGILHTTESVSWPDYPPRYHPHATVLPHPGRGVDVRQHVAFAQASYALKHDSGAPTNGAHALQFELVGTCDPGGPGGAYYWPDADDAVLRDLYAKVIKPVNEAFGVKLQAPPFKPYPASYGDNGVRFATDTAWLAWHGWAGHEHVRGGNVHGDPGAFPWTRLVHLATGQETDMPLTDDDADKVIDRLLGRAVHTAAGDQTVAAMLARGAIYGDQARQNTDTVEATLAEIQAKLATLTTGGGTTGGGTTTGAATVDDATIAKVVAGVLDGLATRLVR